MKLPTPLDLHLHSDIWGGVAQQLVGHRLAARQTTLDLYAPIWVFSLHFYALLLLLLSFHWRGWVVTCYSAAVGWSRSASTMACP